MSGPGVGFEYPAQEVSWLKRYATRQQPLMLLIKLMITRDVLLFASSIGCTADELHFHYVRPDDAML